MRFGSVCSGIEAASVAFGPLGWSAAWFSEIEPFPSAVLAYHYPDVPNLGDMTTISRRVLEGAVEAPDVLCGGTPCQAFSVAGLRESLGDERGNLTLKFVELADAIDFVRGRRGEQPAVIFWENVPGVLSTHDNAFGCFLAGLAGEDAAIEPPGGKWSNAGCVYGPTRAVAWRTLDAQYFGLPQRRRRVFVVASARDGFDPAAVLFEWDGMRRDSAPSREAREVAPTIPSRSTAGGGLGADFDLDGGVIAMAHGQGGAEVSVGRAQTLTCNHEAPIAAYVTHSLRGEGFDASEDGTGRGTPLVPVSGVRYAHYSHDYANDRITDPAGINPALTKEAHASGNLNVAVHVAFSSKDYGGDASSDLAPTLRAMNHADSHANGGGQMAVAIRTAQTGSNGCGINTEGIAYTLDSAQQAVSSAIQVRRLTPEECEALQGFPRGYTAIPWRKKSASECPDGPRYKALGNSWAVPCVRWIGNRIDKAISFSKSQQKEAA